jgi:hypothetical protein
MTPWVEVPEYAHPEGWRSGAQDHARKACAQLEANRILYFAEVPFAFAAEDREFLTSQRGNNSAVHKNVSYRPATGEIHGFEGPAATKERLRQVLRTYSLNVTKLVRQLLAPYDGHFTLDYASFRPIEENGRDLPLHKRNDLLHVDAFPSRPTHGARILRVFTNLHPEKVRVWNVGEEFAALAEKMADDAGLPAFAKHAGSPVIVRVLRAFGAPLPDRSAYDRFMLHFHDYLKENTRFQADSAKTRIEFPPLSTWLVFTDGVPHAVLSGQHALEQTFIVAKAGLVSPENSPIAILERLSGRPLTPRSVAGQPANHS